MSRKDLPRLAARRTPEIEALLQEIWRLRPDLAEQNKLTIFLSLGAFVRESQGAVRLSPVGLEKNDATKEIAKTQLTVPTDRDEPSREEPTSLQKESNISDDVEWD